jgi:glutamyl-tRNA synthetase
MRVRFPPSPTGALHIGNARTALYNWLLARGHDGTLVLRIEDTDRERSTPENVQTIFDALAWLGIDWDEGPILQSANAERHAEVVEQLLADGHAYRSTAGPDEVRAFKEANGNRGFRGTDEGTGAVRLRVPDEGVTVVRDVIRGETAFENALLDDLVIARADGTPVYHLAVVVDDADAGITHVVRGADH